MEGKGPGWHIWRMPGTDGQGWGQGPGCPDWAGYSVGSTRWLGSGFNG